MKLRRLSTLLAFAVLCATLAPAGANGAPARRAHAHHASLDQLAFAKPVVLTDSGQSGAINTTCYNPCGEPSLVVSPDGILYVSTPRTLLVCCNTIASPVWTSTDEGRTWSKPIFPSAPAAAGNAFTGGDTQLAVDKRGTVYEGELWLGSDSMYISSDAGQTWQWSPLSHDPVDDREWLVYSPQEDALYGVYDALPRGLEVMRVPLNTPLGSSAALAQPVSSVIAPYWLDCPAVAVGPCQPKPNGVPDAVNGVPFLEGSTSPGRPAIDPRDGTLYFPFPYQVAGRGIAIATTSDGASSWQYRYVSGAGHSGHMDTGNDFPVAAVDAAGRLYIAWSEDKGDGYHVYLSSSANRGISWVGPIDVSGPVGHTAIFPNVVAGGRGRVAVSWFGTRKKGDPNQMPKETWSVYVAVSRNATRLKPTFDIHVAERGFHEGNVCTHGLGCTTNDRKLLDFFDMALTPDGALLLVYARDAGDTGTEIAFVRQETGCSLRYPHHLVGGPYIADEQSGREIDAASARC